MLFAEGRSVRCHAMNPAQFKAKWGKFAGKESAAYQDHFGDLCRLLKTR
jgi:hypothetical protein